MQSFLKFELIESNYEIYIHKTAMTEDKPGMRQYNNSRHVEVHNHTKEDCEQNLIP